MAVGIAGAMDEEIRVLLQSARITSISNWCGHGFHSGSIHDRHVVLTTTGIGKARAAARTQALLDRYSIRSMFFVGIAGAINPELRMGDLVIGGSATQHDFSDFSDAGGRRQAWYDCDPGLIEIARRSAEKAGPERVRVGRILTGDAPVTDAAEKHRLWERFGGDCVEMEGAAVGMVCSLNKVPFVLVRCISDMADANAMSDARVRLADCSRRAALVALEMMKLVPDAFAGE